MTALRYPVLLSTLLLGLGVVQAQSTHCDAMKIQAAAPGGMRIESSPTLMSPLVPQDKSGITAVEAQLTGADSGVCLITGAIETDHTSNKTTRFAALLPSAAKWNGKFLFIGCGGNCGSIFLGRDELALVSRGYSVWKTDDGHAYDDASWTITKPGVSNDGSITDFAYRAVHTASVVGKQFVAGYYEKRNLQHAYYQGCSVGGREGMVEASRYPDDFDGYLVGAPYFDVAGQTLPVSHIAAQLRYPDGNITGGKMLLATTIALAKCDSSDGVKDSLIQNPALCDFNPEKDLPRCEADKNASNCFTEHQIQSLSTILTAITDKSGAVIHPGYSVSDMTDGHGNLMVWAGIDTMPKHPESETPWGDLGRQAGFGAFPYAAMIGAFNVKMWAYLGDPRVDPLHTPEFAFLGENHAKISQYHVVSSEEMTRTLYSKLNIASGDFPDELGQAIQKNKKVILYHGLSDGLITPYRTIQYVRELAKINGGYETLGKSFRFYAVPGMGHCSGGPGPNNFGQYGRPVTMDAEHDALSALEKWVEDEKAPESLIATHVGDSEASPVPTNPPEDPVPSQSSRTMPLCVFPASAHYRGAGDVKKAENWYCPANDSSMLNVGYDGAQAGADAPLFTGTVNLKRDGKAIGMVPDVK